MDTHALTTFGCGFITIVVGGVYMWGCVLFLFFLGCFSGSSGLLLRLLGVFWGGVLCTVFVCIILFLRWNFVFSEGVVE